MKKHMVSAVLLLIMMLSLSAQAAEMRVITASPYLTFNENTATCMADCKSTNPSDKVSATLTLYQGSTCVTSWSGSGNGRVIISKSCTVKSGMEYKLVLSYAQELLKYLVVYQIYLSQPKCAVVKGRLFLT